MNGWLVRIPPRRAAFEGVVCLIIGAVTTVAVAWGCTVRNWPNSVVFSTSNSAASQQPWIGTFERVAEDGFDTQMRLMPGRFHCWQRRTFGPGHGLGALPIPDAAFAKRLPSFSIFLHQNPLDSFEERTTGVLYFEETGSGWPYLAMSSASIVHHDSASDGSAKNEVIRVQGVLRTSITGQFEAPIQLPFRPIWPGFAIDTLFYAAIWFGVFFGFAGARRFIRAKRGRCPHCGYDLRGKVNGGCPECGWGRAETPT